ncbi:hypothetical protein [Amycolatopsis sp. PS_44_ISF1]|uniref:hypothetical protein n=1 Tax=Amycolatopsis sp. PS_44_ISF1 TaxID=2974917 RepID=UPI0028E06028|nr:hypothetical protein [Amycolatopsis sp. PS_44_ISF1]MDT8913561.1 hypothetical protein [Amycolatopsis sp. PS_44_ISF1]
MNTEYLRERLHRASSLWDIWKQQAKPAQWLTELADQEPYAILSSNAKSAT